MVPTARLVLYQARAAAAANANSMDATASVPPTGAPQTVRVSPAAATPVAADRTPNKSEA